MFYIFNVIIKSIFQLLIHFITSIYEFTNENIKFLQAMICVFVLVLNNKVQNELVCLPHTATFNRASTSKNWQGMKQHY